MTELVAISHRRFRRVDPAIFVKRIVCECTSFDCRLVGEDRRKLDACCQYGVDADLDERDAILSHSSEIAVLLREEARDRPWFSDVEVDDLDFPSGKYVRILTHDGGCIFRAHDMRGCAVHRASIAGGWDFAGVKPHVCRLFPISYDPDSIVLSDDYPKYSCSQVASAPTVYQATRDDLGEIFGRSLIEELDAVEARFLPRYRVARVARQPDLSY